jgi:hypothetical protein
MYGNGGIIKMGVMEIGYWYDLYSADSSSCTDFDIGNVKPTVSESKFHGYVVP